MEYHCEIDGSAGTPAAVLTTAQMKMFCRVEQERNEENDLFTQFEKGARRYIEDRARVVMSATTFLYYADMPEKDGRIYLPRWPVTSVAYLKMRTGTDGAQTTLTANTDYRAVIKGHNPHIAPITTGLSWWMPSFSGVPRWDWIEVQFVAGFTDSTRPDYLVDAMNAIINFKHANRGDETRQGAIPQWINDLIDLGASGM